ncbi:cold-shock protein [Mesorhizobium sp. WSM3224]|uniref:cold-shock protein n=1 Tax=Mesorhizobium sp. WSM3224 TaxID=1040986 RepID=UPI000A02D34D|nr:cold-shock protein [Mesorhizobium sp. WSM3224]
MSKYRDHRKQHHRRGDDELAFSERASEPSYFQRPQSAIMGPMAAEVKWFDATKGFGFVKLADGADAYLHIRVLEAARAHSVSEGARLKVTVEEGPKGRQVGQILEIGEELAKASAHTQKPVPEPHEHIASAGTVKWYNPEKGFGFIAPESGEKDVFVHVSALARSGLTVLVEGQKVLVECGRGKKGLEVQSIRLASDSNS